MALVLTDTARRLFAARDAGGASPVIDNIRIGTGTNYDAAPSAKGVTDTNPTIQAFAESDFSVNQRNIVLTIRVEERGALTATEIGFYDAGNLIFLWSTAGENIFVKAANTNAVVALGYTYMGSGVPTNLTGDVTINVPAKASRDTAVAGTDDDDYMTALRVKEAIDEFSQSFADDVTGADVWNKLRATLIANLREGEGINISDTSPTITLGAEDATTENKGVVELETTTETEGSGTSTKAATGAGVAAHYDSRWVEVANEAAYDALTDKDDSKHYWWPE